MSSKLWARPKHLSLSAWGGLTGEETDLFKVFKHNDIALALFIHQTSQKADFVQDENEKDLYC